MCLKILQALERRQRILLDMALDAELLPEQRWPYRMPRARVRPAPPPVFDVPHLKVGTMPLPCSLVFCNL